MIDTSFDFRTDTPEGRDPDKFSPTLHRCHQMLWSKELPGGSVFELTDGRPANYLEHNSTLGRYWLSSDAAVASFRYAAVSQRMAPDVAEELNTLGYTIGGMMIWPSNRISKKMTINGARGCHAKIRDRFDLTVECIRRHYHGDVSPLSAVLERYADYFQLFATFEDFIEFFFLQDLVLPDGRIRFALPFDGFETSPVPANAEAYLRYRESSMEFICARNARIDRSGLLATRLSPRRPARLGVGGDRN